MGNSNTSLLFSENLFEGARAWYFHVAGGMGATFSLPNEHPILIPASTSALGMSSLIRYRVARSIPRGSRLSNLSIVLARDPRPIVEKE